MNKLAKIALALFAATVLLIIVHILYLKHLAEADTYPIDTFLVQNTNKNALVIVAHDDDAISMSGTISFLVDNGWKVRELCFYQGFENKDSIRKIDLVNAANLLGMSSVEFYDIELRKNRNEIQKPWLPIPYSEFDSAYNKQEAQNLIETFIKKYNPSVIFTLDDIMGGYGHPDHVYISKLIIDYCKQHQNDSLFSIERIYQAVFDPQMNEKILKNMEAFQLAKKIYDVQSSPKPDVYVSLQGYEAIKKKALQTYTTEQHSLTSIWPFYNYYPAGIYFKIFDKEYYRVLNKNENFN